MDKKHKCIHIFVKIKGFDNCEKNLITKKLKDFAERLSFSFSPDYLSVSSIEEKE